MVRTTARATSTRDAAPDYLAGLFAAANEILNESHPPQGPDGDDDGVEVDDHGRSPGDNDEEELDEEVEIRWRWMMTRTRRTWAKMKKRVSAENHIVGDMIL